MSPFDLRGPQFLVFYLTLGTLVVTLLFMLRRLIDPAGAVKVDMSDPYLIAFLRGGKDELVRVATISLVHRKLLQVSDTLVSVTSSGVADSVRIPIERQLLLYFANSSEGVSAFSDPGCTFAAEAYSESLEKLGLLPDDTLRTRRLQILGLALALLLGVAFIKITIALSRGHANIGFLILLAGMFGFAAVKMTCPRLTVRGRAILDDLRFLFGPLNSLSSTNLSHNDVALLAAVFGINAVPLIVFPYARTLYPKAAASFGSSCGAGCGSIGGDSGGGGGCGGGGCGGGCGGCGG
jgi:uncharacterized protein (TIGR04222 family)